MTTGGEPVYAPAVSLACRSVDKSKNIIAKDGETITVTASVTLFDPVAIGDLLDGREVVGLNSLVTVGGATIGYQALTR